MSTSPPTRIPRPGAARLAERHVVLDRGAVNSVELMGGASSCFGLVVLEGLMVVEVATGRASAAWLIGPDDVIRPWEISEIPLLQAARWRALETTRLLRLGPGFQERARHDPAALHALASGAARTSHWLLTKSLIVSSPVVEERLLLLFALLGERWGKVTPSGVLVNLPLTHELLAGLIGARRPSVTHALRSLKRQGAIECSGRGSWLLRRLGEDGYGSHPEYAVALGFLAEGPVGAAATG